MVIKAEATAELLKVQLLKASSKKLANHPDVTIIADAEALSLLKK